MQFIHNFIDWVVNTFNMIWNVFTSILDNITLMIQYIGRAVSLATQCVLSLPVWLQTFGVITISISVLYLIIGRDAGRSE